MILKFECIKADKGTMKTSTNKQIIPFIFINQKSYFRCNSEHSN